MTKFADLGISKEQLEVFDSMGFTEPTEIQAKAIPSALMGKDVVGGSATGSGKTLAFAVPMIEKITPGKGNVQALVMTPTRELAEQVAKSIRLFGKHKKMNVIAIYGGVNIEQQMRKIKSADIVVGTPGRILDHLNRGTLNLYEIDFLVLDEVDRMFDMGFYKDVERILDNCSKEKQVMLFSATISSDMDHLVQKHTKNAVEIVIKSYIDYSQLNQIYYEVEKEKKFSLLVHLLKDEKSELVIVFCSTRRNTEFVFSNLSRLDLKPGMIHGGMPQNKRLRVLEEFNRRDINILVCTDVAARGLDIKDVSHVYNYDIPADTKDYVHRIGRTARAGKKGKAINILVPRDYQNFSDILASEKVEIHLKQVMEFETVRIKIDERDRRPQARYSRGRGSSGRDGRSGGSQGRRDSRGGSNSYGRSSSYGSRDSRPKYGSKDSSSRGKSSYGSRDSKPRTGGYSRDSKPRSSYGSRDSSSRGSSGSGRRSSYGSRDSKPSYGSRDSKPRSSYGSRDSGSSRGSYSRDSKPRTGGYSRDSKPRSSYGSRDSKPRTGGYSRDSKPRTGGYSRDSKPRSSYGSRDSKPSYGSRDSKPRTSSRDSKPRTGGFSRDSKPRSRRPARK